MRTLLKIEESAMTLVGIYFLHIYNLGLPVWLWIILFFSPDIGMLGYLFGNRAGAVSYNVFHHKALALAIAFSGYFSGIEWLMSLGILLFTHSSFDRVAGYGLKYFKGFQFTHLGDLKSKEVTAVVS